MADFRKPAQGALKAIQAASKAADEKLAAGKLKAALEAQQAPMTTPRGTGLPLMPRDNGMYTLRDQKDLPRMPTVDKARAENRSPKYNERTQDLLDSRKARGKVDELINKGKALDVQEWYGTEPLRQVAMDAGRTPEQFESLMAQLASASQRNPVDKQNQMGSYLYHLSETGQLPDNSLLLTNKLKKALKDDPSLAEGRTLVELPTGYGSLAQGDIFNRALMISQGKIGEALPPNKKLGTFYENLLGNLRPVTVDVNALRGPIIEQGDPRWLASKLVEKDDKGKVINSYKPREMFNTGEMTMREAQQRPGFWEAAPKGSEYAGFEELWQRGAKRHGVEPAEAQALGWYGSADVTALKTKPENYVDNLERLIKRTAEQTGKSPTEVMNDMVTGKGFLRKDGGAVERKETAEEMDKFHKCFNMHKAFGGAVVKKVDGGKIAKGVMGAFDKASKAADAAMAGSKASDLNKVPSAKQLMKSGQAVSSEMDAVNRFGNGERLFAFHEMSETPFPIRSVDELKNFTYDQLLSLPTAKANGGGVHMVDGGKMAKGVMGAIGKASAAADAAMAEANLKKMLEPSAVQMRLYHGTTATEGGKGKEAIRRLKPSKEGALGSGVYMTPNTPHASSYTGIPNDEALAMMSQGNDYTKKMADQFMADRAVGRLREGQAGGNMLPVYAQIKNPLIIGKSGRNIDPAADALMGLGMDEASAIKLVERAFEEKGNIGKQIQSRAQAQGYDGIMQYRGDELSEVVSYNPNAIKSAIGNQGTYDITHPDLSKANGGAMRMLPKKTEGFEEEKPMDKSVLEKMHQVIKEVPKLPTSPLGSALNLGYEGYKYFTGKDPVGDFQKELNRKLNPRMDTGSAPVQEFEKFAKGGRVQESPEEMERFHKCFAMHKAFGGAVKKPQKFDNGGIASPSDEVNQGAAFGIYQKPKGGEDLRRGGEHSGFMAELLAKMAKDQGKQEVSSLDKPRAATDLLNRGVLANNPLSAVIDMVNMGLVPLDVLGSKLTGRDIKVSSEKPFLGSEYVKDLMNQYGVTSGEERPMMETALSFASPTAMIKGAIKATDAAKKAPELMKKASDAFTSSKMSPLATEAKTASAGKPTGATYATKQEGPFFRVSPTTLDTSKAKTRGIREGDELQGPAPIAGGAGSTGRETPQLLSSEEVGRIIADPVANEPLNIAKKYTQETQGVDFGVPNIPESSLAKQSAIGRAQQLAVEGSPEYKTAVFDAYAKQMPDVLEQAGAKNYDDLMEKAYRQMAKETDDQFKILPYNFSYHRAGEGNYNGAMDMASDVHGNKHLYVYQGGDKHDFLNRIDPSSGLNENEKFRAVHDLLGHAIYGNQFGPKGEEMAWAVHSQMYSPLARLAMTAETRGQNSMVNYSPLNANLKAELAKYDNMANEARRKGDQTLLNKINAAKRQAYAGFEFAPNKAVLLPPEFLSPQYAGGMPDYLQAANRPAKGTETQSALTHFSNDPNLQMLDPKRYGTGIKGAEAERLRDYAGGVKDRSYFYMGEPSTVTPEAGLGVNRYRGEASSLYDITQDPLNFQTLARESNRTPFTAKVNQGVTYPLQDANDIERLVKEYGYEGMANPKATKPMAIMFKETPVRRQARGGLTLMK